MRRYGPIVIGPRHKGSRMQALGESFSRGRRHCLADDEKGRPGLARKEPGTKVCLDREFLGPHIY